MKNKFNILLISLIISVFYPQDKIDPVYTGSFGSVTINNQVYNHFDYQQFYLFLLVNLYQLNIYMFF